MRAIRGFIIGCVIATLLMIPVILRGNYVRCMWVEWIENGIKHGHIVILGGFDYIGFQFTITLAMLFILVFGVLSAVIYHFNRY